MSVNIGRSACLKNGEITHILIDAVAYKTAALLLTTNNNLKLTYAY